MGDADAGIQLLAYNITRWSGISGRDGVYPLTEPWFEEGQLETQPRAVVSGIGEHDGVLWVIGSLRDPEWGGRVGNDMSNDPPVQHRVDGIIDVRDPATLELLAHAQYEDWFLQGGFIPGTDLLAKTWEDETGATRFILVRPRFSR